MSDSWETLNSLEAWYSFSRDSLVTSAIADVQCSKIALESAM